METVRDFIFLSSKITADGDCSHEIKRCLLLGRNAMTNLDSIYKSRDIIFPAKVSLVKAMVFPVVMYELWELDYKESWELKNWCFWTAVLEKTLESPLDCKEIQPVNPKGNQSWIFIGKTTAEGEIPILWPPDMKNWLLGKDPAAGEDWCWGGEGDDRGWDGWMASPTQWIWVWANSRRWWWTGKPGMLQSMGSQRVKYDWATELKRVSHHPNPWVTHLLPLILLTDPGVSCSDTGNVQSCPLHLQLLVKSFWVLILIWYHDTLTVWRMDEVCSYH